MAESKRENWLDALKGIGILFTMLYHAPETTHISVWLTATLIIFFMAAGYTYKPRGTWKEFLISKAKRMLIPFVVYGVVIAFISECSFRSRTIDMNAVGRHLLGLLYGRSGISTEIPFFNPQMGPLWFLTGYFVTIILFRFLMEREGKMRYVMVAIYMAIGIGLAYIKICPPWNIDLAFPCAVAMFGGYLAKQSAWKEWGTGKKLIWAIIFIAVGFPLSHVGQDSNFALGFDVSKGFYMPIIYIFSNVILVYGMGILLQLIDKIFITKWLAWLGQISMVLLTTHYFVFVETEGLLNAKAPFIQGVPRGIVDVVVAIIFAAVLRFILRKLNWKYLM